MRSSFFFSYLSYPNTLHTKTLFVCPTPFLIFASPGHFSGPCCNSPSRLPSSPENLGVSGSSLFRFPLPPVSVGSVLGWAPTPTRSSPTPLVSFRLSECLLTHSSFSRFFPFSSLRYRLLDTCLLGAAPFLVLRFLSTPAFRSVRSIVARPLALLRCLRLQTLRCLFSLVVSSLGLS